MTSLAAGETALIRKDRGLASLVLERLDVFAIAAFHALSMGKLENEPYIEVLARALHDVLEGKIPRLLVNMPPRHLKSFMAAVCLPAFALARDPKQKIGVVSYSQELAREHTNPFNRLIETPFYRRLTRHIRFDVRQDNARTHQGGGRKSFTVTGGFTGMGVDFLILDDLTKAQDARSSAERDIVERFYRETAVTRFNDQRRAKLISVQQRLHVDDICAQLMESGTFHHLNLPSIAPRDLELPRYNGRVWKFQLGELLSPCRFPHDVLDRLRDDMGLAAFSAQYLQDPLPDGTAIVDVRRLHLVDEPFSRETLQYKLLSIDTAIKDTDTSDYSVITAWGFDGYRWCLVDMLRERLVFPDLIGATKVMIEKWNADRVLIEDANVGYGLRKAVHHHHNTTAVAFTPEGTKIERLSVGLARLYSGSVVLPRNAPFFDEVVRELRAFPSSRHHDDIVDSMSLFLNWGKHNIIHSLIDTRRRGRRR